MRDDVEATFDPISSEFPQLWGSKGTVIPVFQESQQGKIDPMVDHTGRPCGMNRGPEELKNSRTQIKKGIVMFEKVKTLKSIRSRSNENLKQNRPGGESEAILQI